MEKKMMKTYREVKLDVGGFEKSYRNPLTKKFQYEYALYEAMTGFFASVRYQSMAIDRLRLFFKELPLNGKEKKSDTQEDLLKEMTMMVSRDVIGKVHFPMMQACAAEVKVMTAADGSHVFVFTDGIYGFSIHLDMPEKGHPTGIRVRNGNGKKCEMAVMNRKAKESAA